MELFDADKIKLRGTLPPREDGAEVGAGGKGGVVVVAAAVAGPVI